MSRDTVTQAARRALLDTMSEDEHVCVIGEDVASGGPFGVTKQLADRFGERRVRNTPISEGAIMGAAIGMALGGGRPFVDLMFNDFVTAASDQLFNHAAKIHFMSSGRYPVPLTIWTTGGAGTRWGAQHSQRLDGWFTQVPGLKLLAPATPTATHAAVSAALRDPDPVVVLADRALLLSRDDLPHDGEASPWSARRVRAGRALTVATTGRLVHLAMSVAQQADLQVDLLDMQRLAPLDVEPVLDSLERTSRLLVLHDEAGHGWSAALVAAVMEQGFWLLDAPVARVTAPSTPIPAAAQLEDAYVLSSEAIEAAMRAVLAG